MTSFISAAQIGTGGATTLPGAFYTSPALFQQEQEAIFMQRWLCAGRESQIPNPGDFFARTIGAESILIWRDHGGAIRAFYNVCRHRGTRLCEAAQGTLHRTLQCPYHAWTYDLDGSLRAAPSMEGVEGFRPEDYPLHSVALALWEGFIFISLAQEPEPFEQSYAPLLGKFEIYRLPHLRPVRRMDYDVRANWKLIFENYSECYHCSPVHPTLVQRSPSNSGRNDLTSGPFLGGFMEIIGSHESLTLSGRTCSIPVGDLPEEELRRVYYYSLFPNMLLSLHADYVMVHTLWPLSVERTLIECEWLFHPDAAAHPGFDPDDGVAFWDKTNREDWHVCELSQLGVASRAYTPGPYSPRESISVAFDQELLRALGMSRNGGGGERENGRGGETER